MRKPCYTIASLVGLAVLAAADCSHDNCLRAVIASGNPTRHGLEDCQSYFLATVTAPTSVILTTTTVYTTIPTTTTETDSFTTSTTTSTTLVDTSTTSVTSTSTDTETSTTSRTNTIITTSSVTDTVTVTATVESIVSTTTYVAPGSPAKRGLVAERQVTVIPSAIPTYASACSGAVRYSSACSCAGASASTFTVVPSTTSTVTATVTVVPTVVSTTSTTETDVSIATLFSLTTQTDAFSTVVTAKTTATSSFTQTSTLVQTTFATVRTTTTTSSTAVATQTGCPTLADGMLFQVTGDESGQYVGKYISITGASTGLNGGYLLGFTADSSQAAIFGLVNNGAPLRVLPQSPGAPPGPDALYLSMVGGEFLLADTLAQNDAGGAVLAYCSVADATAQVSCSGIVFAARLNIFCTPYLKGESITLKATCG